MKIASFFRFKLNVLLVVNVAVAAVTGYNESATNLTSSLNDAIYDVTTLRPLLSTATLTTAEVLTSPDDDACALSSADPLMHNTVLALVKEKVSLIEYRLSFVNYTYNPLIANATRLYGGDKWSRITTAHGQTLLSLAFNYGVLSMMTLTFGTIRLDVSLIDHPFGCFGAIESEQQRVDVVVSLLARDFDGSSTSGPPLLGDEERVCHEIVSDLNGDGMAEFRDRCCFRDFAGGREDILVCSSDISNFWLSVLYGMLASIRFCLLFFGPLLFIDVVDSLASDKEPYVVKLKDALVKSIFVCPPNEDVKQLDAKYRFRRIIDMRSFSGFPKLANSAEKVPSMTPVKVRFSQYDIEVEYRRTMTENKVRVGILQTILRAVFGCRLRFIDPLQACCNADLLTGCRSSTDGHCCGRRRFPWIILCQNVANVMLVVFLLPLPYYIRLVIYYVYEYDEVMRRKEAAKRNGLNEAYDSSLLQYFTPTHPLFITVYLVYFLTAFLLAFASNRTRREGRLKKIVFGSFKNLKSLDWTDTLKMAVGNLVWPFKQYGALGCLIGVVYWPLAILVTLIGVIVYTVPTFYLAVRMVILIIQTAISNKTRRSRKIRRYQMNMQVDRSVSRLRTENVLACVCPRRSQTTSGGNDPSAASVDPLDDLDDYDDAINIDDVTPTEHIKQMNKDAESKKSKTSSFVKIRDAKHKITSTVGYSTLAVVCILNLFATMIVLAEVVGCAIEIAVFTVMGVVVNASELLKYVMLILMVFVHVCDCFNGIEKKYLKLNKALFGEVKSRIRDLSEITSLPSFLQENCGFKSQELNEQADYECPDDIAERPSRHWMINDLVLFVDSQDTPRIPKQLFDQVCEIRVAGVPGPVFRGQVEALRQVAKIGAFLGLVFLVVLSFSAVYKLSTTNQLLATVVGGFLPMILRTFVKSPAPDVELGTVSFKSKMDEVIKNFCQYWPFYDLPFELVNDDNDDKDGGKMDSEEIGFVPITDEHVPNIATGNGKEAKSYAVDQGYAGYSTQDGQEKISRDLVSKDETDADNRDIPMANYPGTTQSGNPKSSDTKSSSFIETAPLRQSSRRSNLSTLKDRNSMLSEHQRKTVSMKVDERTEIDILICLPKKYDEMWLDEWSDLESV